MKVALLMNGTEQYHPETTVVLMSGGVESTSFLKHLLYTTNHPIIAVFIRVPNNTKSVHEEHAISLLLPELRKIRYFKYHKVTVDLPWQTRDAEIQVSVLPAIMRASKAARYYRGTCADDWENGDLAKHDRIGKAVGAWLDITDWQSITPLLPMATWEKYQHIDHIGHLFNYTWSCQTPIFDKPCGVCRSCIMRNEAINGKT